MDKTAEKCISVCTYMELMQKTHNKTHHKLAVKYCKKNNTLAAIASYFGVGINEISSNTKRSKEKLLKDKIFKKQIQAIENLLNKSTKDPVSGIRNYPTLFSNNTIYYLQA